MQFAKGYSRVTLVIGLGIVGLYAMSEGGTHSGGGASDIGVYGEGVVDVVVKTAAVIATLHAMLVAAGIALARVGPHEPGRISRREQRWHVACVALMIAGTAYPDARSATASALDSARFHASAWYRLDEALTHGGTIQEIQRWAAKLTREERADPQGGLADDAVKTLRLDVVQMLQAGSLPIVRRADEPGWSRRIETAVTSKVAAPAGAKLAMTRWLVEQGAASGYSLREHAEEVDHMIGALEDDSKRSGDTALWEALARAGMALDRCPHVECPLAYAVRHGTPDQVEFLLERGAHVDARADDGHTTALGCAVRLGNAAMVQVLLSHGATVAGGGPVEDGDIVTACRSNDPGVVAALLAARARISEPQLEAARASLSEDALVCMRRFLAHRSTLQRGAEGPSAPASSPAATPTAQADPPSGREPRVPRV